MHDWTVFYWAWWVSWSPFVGMFIARISRGRTIREFIIAVLLVPTLVTLVWMSSFGISALEQAQNGIGGLAQGIDSSTVSLATFQMLENLPLNQITTGLGIVLVMVFFVTSADSGSLVIDSITAGGKLDAPTPQRVFWAVLQRMYCRSAAIWRRKGSAKRSAGGCGRHRPAFYTYFAIDVL